MIKITNLKQLKKYKTNHFFCKDDDCDHIEYIFQKNNQLQDIEFDININFCLEEQFKTDLKTQNPIRHCFVAKNIKFNAGCCLYKIVAQNLYVKKICDVEYLEIMQTINADNLSAHTLVARNINANVCIVSHNLKCKNMNVKKFVFSI